jgi:hypothetical protein
MTKIFWRHRRGSTCTLRHLLTLGACALGTAACTHPSYQAAAMDASQSGNQEMAISLAKKEVARFSTPDQCARLKSFNCGTLALAYSSLAEYQILAGDRTAGEGSFSGAREALEWMDGANRPGATAMVYRDVSEAYWKVGNQARAIVVFNEGRAAGGDQWLYTAAAAEAADQGTGKSPLPGGVVEERVPQARE